MEFKFVGNLLDHKIRIHIRDGCSAAKRLRVTIPATESDMYRNGESEILGIESFTILVCKACRKLYDKAPHG